MTDTLTNKRGEGHIKTAVIIIIAVVIGGLLIAGIYSLFAGRNGVLKKTEDKLEEMIYTGGTRQLRLSNHQMQYSYDGENWNELEIDGIPNNAVTNYFVTVGEGENTVYLISCTSNRAQLYTSTDGTSWIPGYSDNSYLYLAKSGNGAYISCGDGRSYVTSDGINWTMTSTKNY